MKPYSTYIIARGLLLSALALDLFAGTTASSPLNAQAAPMSAVAPLCSSGMTFAKWVFDGNITPSIGGGIGVFSYGSGLSALEYGDGESGGGMDKSVRFSKWSNLPTYDQDDFIQFDIDTSSIGTIAFSFSYRATSKAPRILELYYSDDGTNFNASGKTINPVRDALWHSADFDVSSIETLDNNPNVKFRIYGYSSENASSTLSFDNVTFCTLPVVTIDSALPNPTMAGTTVLWHALENGDYSLRIGGTSCTDGVEVGSGTYSTSPNTVPSTIDEAVLVEGSNVLRICLTHAAVTDSAVSSIVKDTLAPSIISIKRSFASPTNANTLTFRVTFSEEVNVATVDTSDFIVHDNAPDITTTALVTNVSKFSATEYDVTVSGGDLAPPASFNGVVGLDLNKAPPQNITDLAGNPLSTLAPTTDETYVVDTTVPKIKYFKRQNPLSNPTNADVLTFRIEFSEDVVNVDKNDFTVTTAPSITVTVSLSSVGGSAKMYDVTVSGSALKNFDGEVGLNLKAGQNIQDIVGNPLPTAEPDPPIVDNDQTYSVNNSMPYIISFKRQNPLDSPTSADTLVFRVMFSKDVVNVDTNDFSVNINIIEPVPAAPPTVTKVEPYGASKTIYDVTISGGDLNFLIGEVGLDLSAGQDIKDATTLSNSLLPIEPTIDETYKVINGHPFIKSITRKNPTSSPTDADTLVFRVTFSEVVVGSTVHVGDFDVNIDPSPVGPITVKGITPTGNSSYYDITVSGAGLVEYNGVVGLDLNISPDIVDTNGNVLYPEDPIPAFDQVYEVDNNNLLVKIEQDASQSDPTEVLPIKFTVSFSKPINTATFTTADIKQNGTARGITWNIANPSGDKKNFNLTATKVTVKGTLIPSITAGSVQSAGMPILDNLASISLDNSVTYAIIPTPVRKPTAVPVGRPIINEFLPRPGFDWNHDGRIDVFDEFIEIKNVGPVEINLKGWKLDDEEGIGSSPFVLPDVTLKPGERIVFYGLQTNILLGDGGDSVRLLNPSGKVWDAYTYPIAKKEDQSWCRFPDGLDWYDDCVPTPGLFNAREGTIPTTPQGNGLQEPVCNLPDTLPNDFLMAECNGYGADIWRSRYWDKPGLQGDQNVPGPTIKFETFVE